MIKIDTDLGEYQIEGFGTDVFNETILILDKIIEKIFPDSVKNNFCNSLIMFLESKIKTTPILTEDEKIILKNLLKEYTKIKRETHSENIFVEKDNVVNEDDYEYLIPFNHLFKFIRAR